ncbi:MAG: hypothetical protein JW765_10220 [Deltaproteobacteria bacterium]|nr:hypothetical protein [Candidatus Zymogenaceae bacterium]
MKGNRPFEPRAIIDLQVDHTRAVGASRCVGGDRPSDKARRVPGRPLYAHGVFWQGRKLPGWGQRQEP